MSDALPVLLDREQTLDSVNARITGIVRGPIVGPWLALFGLASSMVMLLMLGIVAVLWVGVGIWGVNIPVGWGLAIVNFVWWVGIGHAGTFISAILLLCRQTWRNSINRVAEAMTLFAIANAGLFPLIHLGRIQRFYYLLPYPSTIGAWPQWRSPLVWDVFAVSTYLIVSTLFWYLGLLPDLASLRDRCTTRFGFLVAGTCALGWRGEARQWQRQQTLLLLLAGLATPLVISVHSVVSFDFAVAIVPGWHSTIFPPYFVAGAILSGFAMVTTLIVPLRRIYRLDDLITARHFNNIGKILLLTSLIVGYGYLMEDFTAILGGNRSEISSNLDRKFGHYAPAYWLTIACNVLIPQLLWFAPVRKSPWTLLAICQFITLGMWTERFMIVITSLHHDFMPSMWRSYWPTRWDWTLLVGTIGLFATGILLFIRRVPMIPIYEVAALLPKRLASTATVERRPEEMASYSTASIGHSEVHARIHALVAEFETADELIRAAKETCAQGYRKVRAYSPVHLEALVEAIGLSPSRLPLAVLVSGIVGGIVTFAFQWWTAAVDYPWNIGGRPDFSWPAFIPITFECVILFAALGGVTAMLLANRFPQLYHPISNTPRFERASIDRFFLAIEAKDSQFESVRTRRFLDDLRSMQVSEVQT